VNYFDSLCKQFIMMFLLSLSLSLSFCLSELFDDTVNFGECIVK